MTFDFHFEPPRKKGRLIYLLNSIYNMDRDYHNYDDSVGADTLSPKIHKITTYIHLLFHHYFKNFFIDLTHSITTNQADTADGFIRLILQNT